MMIQFCNRMVCVFAVASDDNPVGEKGTWLHESQVVVDFMLRSKLDVNVPYSPTRLLSANIQVSSLSQQFLSCGAMTAVALTLHKHSPC